MTAMVFVELMERANNKKRTRLSFKRLNKKIYHADFNANGTSLRS